MFVDLKDLRLCVETGKLWELLICPLVTVPQGLLHWCGD
jgi:hypothetical protein